jgi:ATP-dependent Clp protease ATP-binding subunit ClpA
MTDGRGETVYFSESLIIFTSNLGIYRKDPDGRRVPNVTYDMDFEELSRHVNQGIKDYFHLELGRPEILNRIGNNIVVFDYIRPEVGEMIVDHQLKKIGDAMWENRQIRLVFSDEARRFIGERALANLENGGRGIGNVIETVFLNPLSRYMFDQRIFGERHVTVQRLVEKDGIVNLECDVRGL